MIYNFFFNIFNYLILLHLYINIIIVFQQYFIASLLFHFMHFNYYILYIYIYITLINSFFITKFIYILYYLTI